MNKKAIILHIETVINKSLYKKNIIEKNLYEETQKRINKLLFDNSKNS